MTRKTWTFEKPPEKTFAELKAAQKSVNIVSTMEPWATRTTLREHGNYDYPAWAPNQVAQQAIDAATKHKQQLRNTTL